MFKFYTLDERLTHVKSVYRKYSKIGGTGGIGGILPVKSRD
ncbi:hypothetical protein BROSI_A0071 [Candidatus Brocadia sinica JPN1]|uniref:Uncharacterized protein n=1 Tax=Candidatus Brocadia sinica JPN1 TaxID=1197129 RepID=A0ABQ0JS62_9BACT|nr:hypothetical protein BROSI_A0071 [Candidatus Brocadia sinica JPN1]GIK12403.1 MAG: hypothetical protein BroJett002_11100 [Candidatus Brocadia sinica]GJQ17848.1 MAG: hypothetical protein HBSIN01_18070 [Candidatus Brocadia sinica]